jgi:cellulose biosynthesis protein BcsQ
VIKNSYAIWNNKGGVGKSTITFNVAARYAQNNPHERILVIDMCPQANVSMMLLGGGVAGEAAVHANCATANARTVVGYLTATLGGGALAPLPPVTNYLIDVSAVNKEMPSNMHLVCGDPNLELIASFIANLAQGPQVLQNVIPWVWVHQIIARLIESVDRTYGGTWTVFVDTNPSFSSYTELAVCAVNKLLVPVNADDSSRTAIGAMHSLLYGQTPPHPIYGAWTFAHYAAYYQISVPQIHLVIGNRLTQNLGAAAAFAALSNASAASLYGLYLASPGRFTPRPTLANSQQQFINNYSMSLRDFNTAGVVAAHLGAPVTNLKRGRYPVHGNLVQINDDRVNDCRLALDSIVAAI